MIGIAVVVPVLAITFVATVFGSPHRVLLRLVDIEHLPPIFRFVDVEHLARADGTSTIGVVFVADGYHLQHVFTADALVTTFIEDDTGIVAVIYDGIAHQLLALLPLDALTILFCITCRHGLEQSDSVARLDILFPRGHMHPTDQITIGLHHQVVAVVAQPGWHTQSYGRPLIRGALGIAFQLEYAFVEPELPLSEAGLTEACSRGDFICSLTIHQQSRFDGIKITISPRPEMDAAQWRLC